MAPLPNLRIAPCTHPLQCRHMPDDVRDRVVAQAQGMKRATMSDIHRVDARAGALCVCPDACKVLARKCLHRRAYRRDG